MQGRAGRGGAGQGGAGQDGGHEEQIVMPSLMGDSVGRLLHCSH